MPRDTRTFELGAKRDELTARLEDLAERAADDDSALEEGTRVETFRDALADAADEHGEDATVTIGALTAGEYGQAEDYIKDSLREKQGESVDGASRVVFVAHGLQDAPWLDANSGTDEAVATVSQLSPALVQVLEAEINDLTTPSGNGCASFASMLEGTRTDEASTEE